MYIKKHIQKLPTNKLSTIQIIFEYQNQLNNLTNYSKEALKNYLEYLIKTNPIFSQKYIDSSVYVYQKNYCISINPFNYNINFCNIDLLHNTFYFHYPDLDKLLYTLSDNIKSLEQKSNDLKQSNIIKYDVKQLKKIYISEFIDEFNIFKPHPNAPLINFKEIFHNLSIMKNLNENITKTKNEYEQLLTNYETKLNMLKEDNDIISQAWFFYRNCLQNFESDLKKHFLLKQTYNELHETSDKDTMDSEYLKDYIKQFYNIYIMKNKPTNNKTKQRIYFLF